MQYEPNQSLNMRWPHSHRICDYGWRKGFKTTRAANVGVKAFKSPIWENLIALGGKNSWRKLINQEETEQPQTSSIIYPWDRRYRTWSVVTTAAAAFSGFFIPLEVALGTQAGI
jgi:hypothetical protein